MSVEFVDVVDRNDVPTGEIKKKDLVHKDGDWHRISHVWLVTPDGYVICQKRSKTKQYLPDVWDVIHGGHVKAGSNYIDAAVAELKEEINLKVNPKDLIDIGKYNTDNKIGKDKIRDVCQAFLLIYKKKIEDLKIDNDEVSELRSFHIDELHNLVHGSKTRKSFLPGVIETYFDTGIEKIKKKLNI